MTGPGRRVCNACHNEQSIGQFYLAKKRGQRWRVCRDCIKKQRATARRERQAAAALVEPNDPPYEATRMGQAETYLFGGWRRDDPPSRLTLDEDRAATLLAVGILRRGL